MVQIKEIVDRYW